MRLLLRLVMQESLRLLEVEAGEPQLVHQGLEVEVQEHMLLRQRLQEHPLAHQSVGVQGDPLLHPNLVVTVEAAAVVVGVVVEGVVLAA